MGVSAVSAAVVDAVVAFAEHHRVPLMVLASRNQVEYDDLGGGYSVFAPDALVRHVNQATKLVAVCRDHGGPYFSDMDEALPVEAAAERARETLRRDVAAGFDLIHVDWSRGTGDVVDETLAVIAELRPLSNGRLRFEVGTDETDGGVDDAALFEADVSRFSDGAAEIEFVVGRTGSLVRERFQVGYFSFTDVCRLTSVAHRFGFRFKEHNVDYSSTSELRLRVPAGVDAINIGPELGVLETSAVASAAALYGLNDELDAFFACCIDSGKWRKWRYSAEPPARTKAVVAGHYCQSSSEFQVLLGRLRERLDIDAAVRDELTARIGNYVAYLDAVGEDIVGVGW